MFKPYEFDRSQPVDETGRILLKAADLIRTRGHAKKIREDGHNGRLCIHGALDMAIAGSAHNGLEMGHSAFDRLWRTAIETMPYYHGGGLAWWNNAPGRTADEVISLLEAAAYTKVPA